MATLHQARAYLSHWLNKVDQHSIHSPFFFDFYNRVIRGTMDPAFATDIENIRARLLHNPAEISVEDLGSGGTRPATRRLRDIVNVSVSPPEYAQLMLRICQYSGAKKILELGTSVGLTTLYLSYAEKARIYTFEGSHALVNVALTNFEFMDRTNIEVLEGDIGETLYEFLQRDTAKIGFVFLDANHRYEPTLRYYDMLMRRFNEKSIMVIDDIHNTPEMERAWKTLHKHELVYGSIDLFRCGILFFDPALNKQHFVWSL